MSNINAVQTALTTSMVTPGVNAAEYTQHDEAAVTGGAAEQGVDFSSVLANAMRDEVTRMSVTAGAGAGLSGMPGGFLPIQNQGIEQAILAAASSGEISDAQIALFMLCMMMQTSQDGDFSMLMQMMATMLTQIEGDTGGLRNTVMSSEHDPFVLDTVDRGVFNTRLPQPVVSGRAVLPLEAWRPAIPAITNDVGSRSPQAYRAVINQFNVETAERYRPFRNGSTYCNIFVWDVTSAMGAEIPHYTDPITGEPRFYPDIRGARSMGAIATCEWLERHGPTYGWQEVDAETAQRHANQGKPAITSAGSLGHVQIICPSRDGGFDPIRGVTIAQAGRIVTNYTHISSTYSANALKNNVRYWIHE
jgi:hypothetical protein